MYDLIGDIHGEADHLERLLDKLGYARTGHSYEHPKRTAIFLGDFIDRGPCQRRVIEIARSMVEGGAALAVMGNHEFNAIAFHTPDGRGGHLRPRTAKNIRQHEAFLHEFQDDPLGWDTAISWFRTLPLWLDLPGIRVIHACWDRRHIADLTETYGDGMLTDALLHRSTDRETWEFQAVETLLKGKEIKLPNGAHFHDKDGNRRHEIRVRWWANGETYRDLYMGPESAVTHIPDDPIEGDHLIEYGHHEKPVFLGHYWMDGRPRPLARNIACLDYSVAKPGGKLVAYRWDGEQELMEQRFVWC